MAVDLPTNQLYNIWTKSCILGEVSEPLSKYSSGCWWWLRMKTFLRSRSFHIQTVKGSFLTWKSFLDVHFWCWKECWGHSWVNGVMSCFVESNESPHFAFNLLSLLSISYAKWPSWSPCLCQQSAAVTLLDHTAFVFNQNCKLVVNGLLSDVFVLWYIKGSHGSSSFF